jgi:hypothetical protein
MKITDFTDFLRGGVLGRVVWHEKDRVGISRTKRLEKSAPSSCAKSQQNGILDGPCLGRGDEQHAGSLYNRFIADLKAGGLRQTSPGAICTKTGLTDSRSAGGAALISSLTSIGF